MQVSLRGRRRVEDDAFSVGHTVQRSGVAGNEKADRRSWEAMKQFLAEVFEE